jgi:putative thioredoxin
MSYDVTNFETEVLEQSKTIPVLVDFWAEWCGPCKILGPILERLAGKSDGTWQLKKLDTEAFPEIASKYAIRSIPNVKLFVNGTVSNEFVGALPEQAVERWLKSALPDKFQKDLDEADRLIKLQRYEEAGAILEPIVSANSRHERAAPLLGLGLLFTDSKRAVDLVAFMDEGSKNWEIAETIRTFRGLFSALGDEDRLADKPSKSTYLSAIRFLSEGKFDEALEQFIIVIRADRSYEDDGARKACIAIFKFLGEEHEVSIKHRRDFGNALYV